MIPQTSDVSIMGINTSGGVVDGMKRAKVKATVKSAPHSMITQTQLSALNGQASCDGC